MGSKHDILTQEEVNALPLYGAVIDLLKRYSETHSLDFQSLRVLDWGCGRGKTVIQLLQLGVDAYGVDIDPNPIGNGFPLMRELGHDPEKRLILIQPDCKTPFPEDFFHIVISDQVFEHVTDLSALATEISRITCPGGYGLHIFPSKYCIIEPHLMIPFVHWLPKNKLRYWWIRLMLHKIPLWQGLDDVSNSEKADTYYQYSLNKTYYRSLRQIRSHLVQRSLTVQFYPSGNPSRKLKLLFPILKFKNSYSAKFWLIYSNSFRSVILTTQRVGSLF